uniref:Uncharacterized protein n=2 Tax=Aegilops tauschii subsp. strangulata TaxID=200361 RepID=A0A453TDA6_AEGTS
MTKLIAPRSVGCSCMVQSISLLTNNTLINACALLFAGVVLLEDFKQRLREETSLDAILLDRLALSRDPDADCTVSCNSSDSKVFRQHSKDQPIKPSGVKKKRKRTHDGRHGEAVQRSKKRRKTSQRR